MIFCLLFFVYFPCLDFVFFLISIRKSTNTYIQYINVSICFHCFVGFMYAIFFVFILFCLLQYTFIWRCVSRSVGAETTTALYKFWDMDFTCATHTNCLKFIAASRLLDRFLLSFFIFICIGSTKIVSHFLRNFVERNAVRRTLHRTLAAMRAPKDFAVKLYARTRDICFFNR